MLVLNKNSNNTIRLTLSESEVQELGGPWWGLKLFRKETGEIHMYVNMTDISTYPLMYNEFVIHVGDIQEGEYEYYAYELLSDYVTEGEGIMRLDDGNDDSIESGLAIVNDTRSETVFTDDQNPDARVYDED